MPPPAPKKIDVFIRESLGVMTMSIYYDFKGTVYYLLLDDGVIANAKTANGYDTLHCFVNNKASIYEEVVTVPATVVPVLDEHVMVPEVNIGNSLFYGGIKRTAPEPPSKLPWLWFTYYINFDNFLVRKLFGVHNKTLHVTVEANMYSNYNQPTKVDGVKFKEFKVGEFLYQPIYSYISRQIDANRPADLPYTHRFYGIFEISLRQILKSLLSEVTIICEQSSDVSYYALATACRLTIFNKTLSAKLSYALEAGRDDLVQHLVEHHPDPGVDVEPFDMLDELGSPTEVSAVEAGIRL